MKSKTLAVDKLTKNLIMTWRYLVIASFIQTTTAWSDPSALSEMFFDAKQVNFDQKTKQQNFDGDVIAISSGVIIAADKLKLDQNAETIEATGHVLLLSQNQVFTGTALTYNAKDQTFRIEESVVIANNSEATADIRKRILGFSEDELNYEANLQTELGRIHSKKTQLKDFYRISTSKEDRQTIEEQFSVLLEQEELIKTQKNPRDSIQNEKQSSLKNRRTFWQNSQVNANLNNEKLENRGYFRIQGEVIERSTTQIIEVTRGNFSPCYCQDGEAPAWGFQAQKIDAISGGYAELYNPILEIKGIPILYFPFLKLPLKSRRQSGFMLPNLTFNQNNGSVFSLPLYLDFAPHEDATLTTDFIQKRGTRLAVEYRNQQRSHSGWQINVEALRDEKWQNQKIKRADLLQRYESALDEAYVANNSPPPPVVTEPSPEPSTPPVDSGPPPPVSMSTPAWWQSKDLSYCLGSEENKELCKERMRTRLLLPDNDWRGQVEWNGRSFWTPRFAFVSSGVMYSDHRYTQDLFIPSFDSALNASTVDLYAASHGQFHLDGENFYMGLGNAYADNLTSQESYHGHQMPLNFTAQSPLFSIASEKFPVYGQLNFTQQRILLPETTNTKPTSPPRSVLGNGYWQKSRLLMISPLFNGDMVGVDYFADAEVRNITHDYKSNAVDASVLDNEEFSQWRSWRTGINLSLPVAGQIFLGELFGGDESDFIEHQMNWLFTISYRSPLYQRGEYGKHYLQDVITPMDVIANPSSPLLTYYASEAPFNSNLAYVTEEETLYPHKKIIFSTTHDFNFLGRKWTLLPAQTKYESTDQTYYQKAKRELAYSLDRVETDPTKMFGEDQWYINRYEEQTFNHQTPVHFDAAINYDFLKAEQRQKLEKTQVNLPEPWSPLDSSLKFQIKNWSLNTKSQYNFYTQTTNALLFILVPPSVFDQTLSVQYLIEKNATRDGNNHINILEARTRIYDLSSQWSDHFGTFLGYGSKTKYDQDPSQYYSAKAGFSFLSTANCWGLKFLWKKEFEELTWAGTYYLTLVVKFMNYDREYGNLTSRFNGQG